MFRVAVQRSHTSASGSIRDGAGGFAWSLASEAGSAPAAHVAVAELRGALERHVAESSPTRVFVHAGVVAVDGSAIVLPGSSYAGKSTLVTAFVELGATYYSDEYAVLDADGLVHAFPRPVNLRSGATVERRRLGNGGPAIPIARLIFTSYAPLATESPKALTRGEAMLKMMEHTVCAQTAPARALEAVGNAVDRADVVELRRGEAAEFARMVLDGRI